MNSSAPASHLSPTACAPIVSAAAHGTPAVLREWLDSLIVAFILAMFIRVFLVEVFKIPTGSMTPTLVGGLVAEMDYDRDGRKDLLLFLDPQRRLPLLFRSDGRRLVGAGPVEVAPGEVRIHPRYDRILVSRLAHWFHWPRRGDIVVFKVPPRIWDPEKPIYIKRCVGEPLDRLAFDADGHLLVGGRRAATPDFFADQRYERSLHGIGQGRFAVSEIEYGPGRDGATRIESIKVPGDQVYVFGDNTLSSLDSRFWGGVPLDRLKGRAFFRFYPFSQMRFFHGE